MTRDVLSRVKNVLEHVPELIEGTCGEVDVEYITYVMQLRAELNDFDLVRKTP